MPSETLVCILKSERAQKLARRSRSIFNDAETQLTEQDRNEAFEAAVIRFSSDADWLVKKIEKRTGRLYAGIATQTERELTVTCDGTSAAARQALRLLKTVDDLFLILAEARIRGCVTLRDADRITQRTEWQYCRWLEAAAGRQFLARLTKTPSEQS